MFIDWYGIKHFGHYSADLSCLQRNRMKGTEPIKVNFSQEKCALGTYFRN